MAWDSNFIKNRLYRCIGMGTARMHAVHNHRLEQVRTAMMDCLRQRTAQEVPSLQRRMARAQDVQTLWYLRADLMGVLANGEGESAARTQLEEITQMFQGLLPKALMSRSSSLRS
jgi:hypothetical protein